MALDPQARLVLDAIAKQNRPELSTLSPDIAREDSLRRARSLPPGPEAVVSEESIPGPSQPMPVRVYRPPGSEGRVLPALGDGGTLRRRQRGLSAGARAPLSRGA